MANEAAIKSSLSITKGNLQYQSRPGSFNADVTGAKGPTPGAVAIATSPGTDISFSELTTPGFVRIQNLDSTNFVEFGIWDGSTFHELGELQPGEEYVFRFSRNMSGFRMKADTAAVNCVVEAFEK